MKGGMMKTVVITNLGCNLYDVDVSIDGKSIGGASLQSYSACHKWIRKFHPNCRILDR